MNRVDRWKQIQYFHLAFTLHSNCPLFPCPLLWDNWSNKHNCLLMTTTTYGHEVRWNTRRGTKLIFSLSLQLLVPDQWVSPLACCWIYVRIRKNQNMKWIKLAELGSRVICSSLNLKNNLLLTAKAGKLLGALPVCWLNYLNIAQTSLCTSCQQQFAAHSLSFFHLFIFF